MKKSLLLSIGLATLLTGCGAQQDAESKMARGCEAAVKVMLNKDQYDRQIAKVKSAKFGMSDGFRLVTIDVQTKSKEFGDPKDEKFECKFEETQAFAYIGWKASLIQVRIDDVVYGSEGGEIYGSIEDQMALTAAVENAMK